MANGKIVVPEGMLAAAISVGSFGFEEPGRAADLRRRLESALRWISVNPIVPTHEQRLELTDKYYDLDIPATRRFQNLIAGWERIMFIDPEVPKEIEDLLYPEHDNSRLIEAYRRGKEAGKNG